MILSIDDSRAVHAFIDRSLQGTGWKVIHAHSGKEGLDSLAASGGAVKLILLDWEMPDLSGPEVLKRIRAQGIETPVVMLTSKNTISDMQAVMDAGASEYIMKPFTPEILIEKIRATLGET